MNKYFSLIFIVIFHVCLFIRESNAIEETHTPDSLISCMRFKIGFEFQEINGLCPWALHNASVQKKPLFGMRYDEKNLWHVVIDTNDLEFVTSPFTDEERPLLGICLETLSAAFDILKNALTDRNTITFADWTEQLDVTTFPDHYGLVRDQVIIRPINWEPKFAPQVTLQHSLAWTIPLYFGLLGFDSPTMFNFAASFPYRDILLDALKEGNSEKARLIFIEQGKKINGLVFLHALTLVQMTPLEKVTDETALSDTLECLTKYCQVDAKMKLALMSRRPFSAMYKDIENTMRIPYDIYFRESIMKFNESFTIFSEVPSLFKYVNYGEQFLDSTTLMPRTFDSLLAPEALFNSSFFLLNENIVRSLLSKGVITTAMIRNAVGYESVFEPYFDCALNISSPVHTRYCLNLREEGLEIRRDDACLYDSLSPPWFLELHDSMGNIKDVISEDDMTYGEAIIEVRSIKDVGIWFLKKARLDDISTKGRFLDDPNKIGIESLHLFDFLKSFTKEYFSDIYEGVKSALHKF